jgi:hypothetical protein
MDAYRIRRTLKELKRAKSFHKFLYPGKSPILISTGCKFLLENCDSSFLFDAILKSQELKILKDVKFQSWSLRQVKNDMSWNLSCSTNCDKKPLIIQSIPVKDFPIPELTIWVIQNVALLRQEC